MNKYPEYGILCHVQTQIHSRNHICNLHRFFGVLYGLKAASTQTAELQPEARSTALHSRISDSLPIGLSA